MSRKAMPDPSTVASRTHRACGVPHVTDWLLSSDARTIPPVIRSFALPPAEPVFPHETEGDDVVTRSPRAAAADGDRHILIA